jgi:cysteinyl-tRNA synthetase
MRAIRLHDTASGQVRLLEPRDPGRVGIYACGPTVYGRIHIGNARPYVVFSLLKRFLEHQGLATTLVVNVTDINDKIYDAAAALGRPSAELAAEMTAHYVADTDGLGLGRPDVEPLASQTIAGIVDVIGALLARDAAYAVDGDVYFRVRADPDYGTLSHRVVEDMDQGEDGADPSGGARKEDPLDFALWKAQKPGEDTAWDAPWGRGRPGWHIECSAMAEEHLGLDFEVHGGGSDLLFPHHENEAAQTRAGRGQRLARIWMHNGMLQLGGEKMAKSIGNIAPLAEVLAEHGRDAVLLFFCGGHYRQPLPFTPATMAQATANVRRLRELGRELVPGPRPRGRPRWRRSCTPPWRTTSTPPRALAAVWEWVRRARAEPGDVGRDGLAGMLDLLGVANLLDQDAAGPPEAVVALARERQAAREARDFARADGLRDEIAAAGWTVRDGAGGPELVPA